MADVLRFEPDTGHADWLLREPGGWQELVTAGPRGYEADVRVLPAAEDTLSGRGTWSRLVPHLRAATSTPDDCVHALWQGATGVAAGDEPGLPDAVLAGPTLTLLDDEGSPVREYRLFRGPVHEVGRWGSRDPATGRSTDDELPPPHLLWPADRAWFVASDVDADDTSVSGPGPLVEAIRGDPALATVRPDAGPGRRPRLR